MINIDREFIENYFNVHNVLIENAKKNILKNLDEGFYEDEDANDFIVLHLAFALKGSKVFEFLNKFPIHRIKTVKQLSQTEIIENKQLVLKTGNDDFKDLITEPINENYSWGKYANFNVVICNKNGYINGSFLIKEAFAFENKRRAELNQEPLTDNYFTTSKWNTFDSTKMLFESLSNFLKIPIQDLTFNVHGKQKKGEEMLQGCYFHMDLANSLAMWVSPTYALMVNKIITELTKNAIKQENLALISKNKELTDDNLKKDDMIVEVRSALDRAEYNNKMIMEELNKLSQSNQHIFKNSILISKELKLVSRENKIISKENKIISNKLDTSIQINKVISKENQVISNKLDNTNNYLQSIKNNVCIETNFLDVIVVIRIFDEGDKNTLYYKFVRTTEQYINRRISYYKKKYDENIDIIFNKETANGKSACKRFLCENLNITNRSTTVFLNDDYLQGTFLSDLKDFLGIPVDTIDNITN